MIAAKRRRFLVDVDGVLADFSGGALDVIEAMTGARHTHEDINEWSITGCRFFLGLAERRPGLKSEFWARVGEPGFCAGLKPIAGARALVDALAEVGDVYACTSPFDSATWMRERESWLQAEMGIPRKRIVFASDKHVVAGSMLVDDHPDHVEAWAHANPAGIGLLVDQPYNRGHALRRGLRVESLKTVERLAVRS